MNPPFWNYDLPVCSELTECCAGVVHEHPRIGSDGESEEGSGTSEPDGQAGVSPGREEVEGAELQQSSNHTGLVKLRQKPGQRKLSNQVHNTALNLFSCWFLLW